MATDGKTRDAKKEHVRRLVEQIYSRETQQAPAPLLRCLSYGEVLRDTHRSRGSSWEVARKAVSCRRTGTSETLTLPGSPRGTEHFPALERAQGKGSGPRAAGREVGRRAQMSARKGT